MEHRRTDGQRPEQGPVVDAHFYHGGCCPHAGSHFATSTGDLLTLLVGYQKDGIVLIAPDQTVIWMNRAIEDLFGVNRYDTVGMNAIEFVSRCISPNFPNGEDFKAEFISACFFYEKIPERRYCISRKSTDNIWVEYSSIVIPVGRNRGARLDIYHITSGSDRLEARLQEARDLFETLVALSSDLVISLNSSLIITSVSPSVERFLGYRPEDLAGKHLSFLMTRDSIAEFQKVCFLERVSRNSAGRSDPIEKPRTMEALFMSVQGLPIAMSLGFSPISDSMGNLAGIIAVVQQKTDDSRWREISAQLDQNIEHLACLGDRIRNLLAVIVGLADLQGGEIAEKIVKQAEIIDGVLRELDSGYAASLSAREFLRKHHLRDDLDLDAPPRTEITRPVSGLAKQVSHQSGLFMDTHAPLD